EILKRRWRYLVPAKSHIHNCMLIPNYQEIKYQDFCNSDELSKLEREAAPKPKASARRKISGLDTSITPPTAITTPTTTGAVTPRLTAAVKGKQPAKAKSLSDPSELARTEAQ
nr:hypothetical protein [Tanacetum cinerariifolium]